jgi:hypothetical protein
MEIESPQIEDGSAGENICSAQELVLGLALAVYRTSRCRVGLSAHLR